PGSFPESLARVPRSKSLFSTLSSSGREEKASASSPKPRFSSRAVSSFCWGPCRLVRQGSRRRDLPPNATSADWDQDQAVPFLLPLSASGRGLRKGVFAPPERGFISQTYFSNERSNLPAFFNSSCPSRNFRRFCRCSRSESRLRRR